MISGLCSLESFLSLFLDPWVHTRVKNGGLWTALESVRPMGSQPQGGDKRHEHEATRMVQEWEENTTIIVHGVELASGHDNGEHGPI